MANRVAGIVNRLITDAAVLDITQADLVLCEVALGVTAAEGSAGHRRTVSVSADLSEVGFCVSAGCPGFTSIMWSASGLPAQGWL